MEKPINLSNIRLPRESLFVLDFLTKILYIVFAIFLL